MKSVEVKFFRASARADKQTGVVIASHTTSGKVAARQVSFLEESEVLAERFIWVHAQAEADTSYHKALAQLGAYIELDSIGGSEGEDAKIVKLVRTLVDAGFENKILISQDAGWYNPGQADGGKKRGYTSLTTAFIPKLKSTGLSDAVIQKLTHENPFRAFAVEINR